MKQTLLSQFEELKKANGSAGLCLSNFGGVEIVLSESNDGVLYKWYDKICRRWQEIKYTMKGRAYFTIYGRHYYLDEFMRLNLWGK